MPDNEQAGEVKVKERELGTMITCVIGAGLWWFLSSQPSSTSLMLAAFVLVYLLLGYCLLAVLLPGPGTRPRNEVLVPIPQSEVDRPKAITL